MRSIYYDDILTRNLPKTSQVTSYRAGDDGIHEVGWWKGRLNANNKTRFVAKTISGVDVVVDRATGLMWAADQNGLGGNEGNTIIWNDAIDYAVALNFAGFTDWRIPNIAELFSIIDFSKSSPAIDETLFPNTGNITLWSSTTAILGTLEAWRIYFYEGSVGNTAKGTKYNIRCVRGGL